VLEPIKSGSMLSLGADGRPAFFSGAKQRFDRVVNDAIKSKTASHFAEWLGSRTFDHARAIAENAAKELAAVYDAFDRALEGEIGVIRDQFEAARKQRQRGEVVVDSRSHELQALYASLQAVDGRLDDILAESV
jgi:hypothetical protein